MSSSRSFCFLFFGLSSRSIASISRWTALTFSTAVLHLVDQAALDRLGELDFADALRHLDPRAHRQPPRLAVLPLVARRGALRRFVEFFLQLLGGEIGLADRVDLLLHLTGPLGDALVGDLFVVEDDQLADRPVAGVQRVAQLDHLARDKRRARNRLDHRQLAALDASRDLDFAFAREQRHGAHLAQVHPDGIVGLVERSWREIELELFGAFSRAVDRLVVPHVLLVRIDHLDAGAAKRVEQVVELVGGGNLRRQELVHLVVQQVALFLADVDELPYFVVLFFNRHLIGSSLRQLLDAEQ